MARRKHSKEKRESGAFLALPYSLLRSENFRTLSGAAVKLLMELASQYNGNNNGDLCIAWAVLKERGWRSEGTIHRAKDELLGRGFIEVARMGGKNKASLFALTFFAVDECGGKLDIQPTTSPRSTWRLHEKPPVIGKKLTPKTGAIAA